MLRSFVAGLAAAAAMHAAAAGVDGEAREIYRELIAHRTVHPDGDNTAAARAMARRLLDAGFDPADVRVLEPAPRKGNLVARLRGDGRDKPVLLLAHLDVVDARREDWSDGLDPWVLTERDGYFYARGAIDDKAMAAIFVANLVRLKREGWRPARDVVVALTADEEGGTHNGVTWLLAEHRALIDAAVAINEGAEGHVSRGGQRSLGVQVSEKMYQSYAFEATNPGGHSSLPRRDSAIYDLAAALERLARHAFPARVGVVARSLAGRLAREARGEMARALEAVADGRPDEEDLQRVTASPEMNAQLRTTCVATRLAAGHADNALPQRARAVVNCRLLPGESEAFVASELRRVAGDRVTVTAMNPLRSSEASPVDAPAMKAIEEAARATWPAVEVHPVMSEGATDGSRLRNAGIPVYGVTGLFVPSGENRMHGRDERLGVRAFDEGLEFHYRLLRALAR